MIPVLSAMTGFLLGLCAGIWLALRPTRAPIPVEREAPKPAQQRLRLVK